MKRYIDGMVSDIKDLFDEQEIEKLNNIREEWINRKSFWDIYEEVFCVIFNIGSEERNEMKIARCLSLIRSERNISFSEERKRRHMVPNIVPALPEEDISIDKELVEAYIRNCINPDASLEEDYIEQCRRRVRRKLEDFSRLYSCIGKNTINVDEYYGYVKMAYAVAMDLYFLFAVEDGEKNSFYGLMEQQESKEYRFTELHTKQKENEERIKEYVENIINALTDQEKNGLKNGNNLSSYRVATEMEIYQKSEDKKKLIYIKANYNCFMKLQIKSIVNQQWKRIYSGETIKIQSVRELYNPDLRDDFSIHDDYFMERMFSHYLITKLYEVLWASDKSLLQSQKEYIFEIVESLTKLQSPMLRIGLVEKVFDDVSRLMKDVDYSNIENYRSKLLEMLTSSLRPTQEDIYNTIVYALENGIRICKGIDKVLVKLDEKKKSGCSEEEQNELRDKWMQKLLQTYGYMISGDYIAIIESKYKKIISALYYVLKKYEGKMECLNEAIESHYHELGLNIHEIYDKTDEKRAEGMWRRLLDAGSKQGDYRLFAYITNGFVETNKYRKES